MDNNKTNTTPISGTSRRNFIKKSSIAAGVSMIPASNVWGACNVTGVSGGSQSITTNCVVPNFVGGRFPDKWKQFVQLTPSESDIQRVATILSDVNHNDKFSSSQQLKVEFYYPKLRAFINAQVIQIAGDGKLIANKIIQVGAAVADNSRPLEKHMACTYLNGLFGMNSGLPPEFTGDDGNLLFMDHVWGAAEVNGDYAAKTALKNAYRPNAKVSEAQFAHVLGSFI